MKINYKLHDLPITNNLALLLARENLTAHGLAKKIKMRPATIYAFAAGATESSDWSNVVDICRGLNCDIGDLVKINGY